MMEEEEEELPGTKNAGLCAISPTVELLSRSTFKIRQIMFAHAMERVGYTPKHRTKRCLRVSRILNKKSKRN